MVIKKNVHKKPFLFSFFSYQKTICTNLPVYFYQKAPRGITTLTKKTPQLSPKKTKAWRKKTFLTQKGTPPPYNLATFCTQKLIEQ